MNANTYVIVRINKIMIDTCDRLVCYVRHGASNSGNLLEYAQRRANKGQIQIKNVYESEDRNRIGLVIDIPRIENKRECTVNEYDAFLCELEDRNYLC